jgi:predicted aspartyl protease
MTMGFYPALLPLVGLLLAAPETGQTPPSPPPDETQILLQDVSDRMTVPVSIAGSGPYRFIIDTGAERTVISRQLATMLRLPAGRNVNVVAMSGISRVGTVIIPSLTMSTLATMGAISAPALDAVHLGGMGLLGIDMLQRHKVTIDFDGGRMTVTPSVKRNRSEPRMDGEIVVRAKNAFGQLIVTDAQIDGTTVRVVLDTGSPVSIGNTPLLRLVRRNSGKFEPLELTSATGVKIQTQYTRAHKLRVGGIEFTDMPIAFSDAPPFGRFGLEKKPAMLLGMNALKYFRQVEIDFPNREVRFQLPRRDRMAAS